MTSRAALTLNLAVVEAAVSDSTAVPVLGQFWFTGKRLTAYNGIIGISVPCETKFTGGVPSTLKKLLDTSAATDIELVENKDALEVRAASSKFKLAKMPLEDFDEYLKAAPPVPREPHFVDVAELRSAMQMAMRSVGNEKVRADMMGVTFIRDKKELYLFGTDAKTVSHGRCRGNMEVARAIVPIEFCKQAVALFKEADDAVLEITETDCVMHSNETGTKLWASTLEPDKAQELDFFGDVLDKNETKFYPIPEKFNAVFQRAAIIGKSGVARTKTEVNIEKGEVELYTKSESGEVRDTFALKGHPVRTVAVDAVLALAGADLEEMAVTENSMVFASDEGRLMYFVGLLD